MFLAEANPLLLSRSEEWGPPMLEPWGWVVRWQGGRGLALRQMHASGLGGRRTVAGVVPCAEELWKSDRWHGESSRRAFERVQGEGLDTGHRLERISH
jgi:hypothetical protein